MDIIVRRRALGAAAKVALALSLPACASPEEKAASGHQDLVSTRAPAATSTPAPDAARTTPPGRATAPDAAKPCDDASAPASSCEAHIATIGSDAGTVSDEAAACCREFFAENTEEPVLGWAGPVLTEGASLPKAKACCSALAKHAAENPDDVAANETVGRLWFGTCCAFQLENDSMACTPWGPPVPPAMRARTRAKREQLALQA